MQQLRVLVVLALAAVACEGRIEPGQESPSGLEDQMPSGHEDPTNPVVPRPSASCNGPVDVGPGLILRLTHVEYDNTVRDLLGDSSRPSRGFIGEDAVVAGFHANPLAPPSEAELDSYRGAAETLADKAITNLPALVPCTATEIGSDGCADKFIRTFGRRAFRRALDADEVRAYTALFQVGKSAQDFAFGIALVLRAMLQSPAFLYRIEVGTAVVGRPGLLKLTPYELASRMSYVLWRSMPDEELLTAAESGKLDTPAGIEAQARRMLTSPTTLARVRGALADFAGGWMGIPEMPVLADTTKDPAMFRTFATLVGDMQREQDAFFQEIMLNQDARVSTLLTATYTVGTARLAALYGAQPSMSMSTTAKPTDLARFDLPAGQRFGILTQAGLMSVLAHETETSPIHRGLWVRSMLLCQPPPPPPDNIADLAPKVDPKLPIKQRLSMHRASSACASCHSLMDPVGFAFENYDPIGAYRTMTGRAPVDATGELTGTDVDGPLAGVGPLADKVARSAQVRGCMTRQWMRFAFGRHEDDADQCTVDTLTARMSASKGDMKDLLMALTLHEGFRHRRPAEVTP